MNRSHSRNESNPWSLQDEKRWRLSVYGFEPNKGAPIAFCMLFAISTIFHIYQNVYVYTPLHNLRNKRCLRESFQ